MSYYFNFEVMNNYLMGINIASGLMAKLWDNKTQVFSLSLLDLH